MNERDDWHPAFPLEELEPGSIRTFKKDGLQAAVGRTLEGEVFAVDNRCPHEGYPLAQGTLKGCSLTCCWHNWKFDVRDGRCLLGGEGVRSFPTRVREGRVELDLAPPDPAVQFPAWRESLAEGLFRHDNGRAIRDGVRLLQGGYDPFELLADVASDDGRRAEYGTTHTLAVAADCARFVARRPGPDAMVAIAPVIDLCGEPNRRLPERALPEPLPYAGEEESGRLLREAVEAEEVERARGLLRGAFLAGVGRETVERWLLAVIADHFLDFGHQLIYLVKARDLLERVSERHARDVYDGLLVKTCLGTREDTLPYMRGYAERLAAIESELPELHAACSEATPFDADAFAQLRDAVLDGSRAEAFDAVLDALRRGVHPRAIAVALVAAAARRFFRFDVALDADPGVAENWLWVSHRFTFASAVREAAARFDGPEVVRLLFQAVMFVHSGKPMDLPPERRSRPTPVASARPEDVLAAIAAKDTERAVGAVAALLDDVPALEELERELEELCLSDPLVRPIVVAHAIKVTVAAFDELRALRSSPDRAWPLLAAVRFLASPVVERRVRETVGRSIRWVAEGTMPRKLTQ